MSVVWKYPIRFPDEVIEVAMPEAAKVVLFAEQAGVPTIWVQCDPTRRKVIHRFRFAGTGHLMDNAEVGVHLGSCICTSGLVWHLFAMGESA